jgi:hypothetical protein
MATRTTDWIKAVCEGLGFDPGQVSRITIELDALDKVTLKIVADARHSQEVIEMLKESGHWADHIAVGDGETERKFVRAPKTRRQEEQDEYRRGQEARPHAL